MLSTWSSNSKEKTSFVGNTSGGWRELDSFWMAILPLLLKGKYRATWYCKSTLTSSAE